jgi:hypothetical protein
VLGRQGACAVPDEEVGGEEPDVGFDACAAVA